MRLASSGSDTLTALAANCARNSVRSVAPGWGMTSRQRATPTSGARMGRRLIRFIGSPPVHRVPIAALTETAAGQSIPALPRLPLQFLYLWDSDFNSSHIPRIRHSRTVGTADGDHPGRVDGRYRPLHPERVTRSRRCPAELMHDYLRWHPCCR